ncbi:MAG: 16S rRNA (guanine(966)-N(2))-methyltransferase RsmD [Nocardioidaceae bacterium]
MTRIIAGTAGGRRLTTPPGDATRPTTDRVREAVFSSLESTLRTWAGRRFLDLYAGSGAVGLEALSRGAAHATLVEKHAKAAALAQENARRLQFSAAEIVVAAAERYVRQPPEEPYDVVFLDPPYTLATSAVGDLLGLLADRGWLAPGGLVAVERSSRDEEPAWPDGISPDRAKRYGETVVWYGHAV